LKAFGFLKCEDCIILWTEGVWLSDKNYVIHNILSTAALWGLLEAKKCFCFQKAVWKIFEKLLVFIKNLNLA
jgi:hypothetical protein